MTLSTTHNEHPLKHLSWNHTGTELAVTNVFGHITVYTVLMLINRCIVTRQSDLGVEDNLGAVVGLMWLNQDRSVSSY